MRLAKGPSNSLTDVSGVKVGHVTLDEHLDNNEAICTGVTAILPHGGDILSHKVPAGCHIINGFGKSAGLIQLEELGELESPIMLTNTFSVGAVLEGTLQYMISEQNENADAAKTSINTVVGECNDSYLNTIQAMAVRPEHAAQAIETAAEDPVQQGAVGAGKGMVCFGFKGGIGSASRMVPTNSMSYTVSCLVLSNFGKPEHALFADWEPSHTQTGDGSIMIILATDAPLDDRQLKRLAKRSSAGLARTGSIMANGSGDIAIAFSTAKQEHQTEADIRQMQFIPDRSPTMNDLFHAVVETTEAAIMNALAHAETTYGRHGRCVKQAPLPSHLPDY